eukprot:TRINITY_DN54633_c0_g1_i1.p1 TRINITY_DN54633_c0_g1~~TRINITY_DN54633_c0_g1_i1.p1  ORF type:complete len:454 (+),score=98.61 TRINITY_DN54633_c0_g1_i1:76-1362(+)
MEGAPDDVCDDLAMPGASDEKFAYRRLKLLGQGTFGKAFLTRDLSNNELCVMKQVRVEKMDAKARDTAIREAVALRKIRHPNVVGFRQVFVRSGWLCLVMDFADGGDLCAAVKERARSKIPFEESAVLECFAQVADAVRYVHAQKMVHRDIKSRNIFLCRTGRALLGDFGLVRLLESTCELAHTRVGTPYYLSPEIIRKQPYNYKTDIWSLGVLLYEMAALQRPFQGTLETLPKVILKGQYEELGAHYSQGLKDLVAGMLRVEPEARSDLDTILCGPVLSGPLERSRVALDLQVPPTPEPARIKRADRMRKEVQESAEQMKSEWIGYNTMVRRSADTEAALAAARAGTGPPAAAVGPAADAAEKAAELLGCAGDAAATMGAGQSRWSVAPQRDPDSADEDLGSASSDSWGSVVDTGVDAVQQAVAAGN